jgi:hypothetical protein
MNKKELRPPMNKDEQRANEALKNMLLARARLEREFLAKHKGKD